MYSIFRQLQYIFTKFVSKEMYYILIDEEGIVHIGLYDFLLNPDSLEA